MQRFAAALLVDHRAREGALPAVARTIEYGIGEGEGGAPDAGTVALLRAGHQVDQARERPGELQRDREEGPDRGRRAAAPLRGEKPPVGRLQRRRDVRALS